MRMYGVFALFSEYAYDLFSVCAYDLFKVCAMPMTRSGNAL